LATALNHAAIRNKEDMPVPDFQSMMLPFLRFAADGQEHELREVTDHIAEHFKLSPDEKDEPLPSGNQTRLDNRVGWCRTHLKHANLIQYIRRGVFRITERGKQVLAQNPPAINLKFLDQFPEHQEWFHGEPDDKEESVVVPAAPSAGTPEEQMDAIARKLEQNLVSELRERMHRIDPRRFELLVLDVLLAMGYGGSRAEAAEVGKGSNDGGIDGLINEDRLGLDRIYVQAKRWDNPVGRPEIQNFVGALAGHHAHKGIFITTSEFSSGAREYVKNLPQRVILIDGRRLAELMIEHSIGVAPVYAYKIRRVDSDYFEEQ
jgi:restriction system protein